MTNLRKVDAHEKYNLTPDCNVEVSSPHGDIYMRPLSDVTYRTLVLEVSESFGIRNSIWIVLRINYIIRTGINILRSREAR